MEFPAAMAGTQPYYDLAIEPPRRVYGNIYLRREADEQVIEEHPRRQ